MEPSKRPSTVAIEFVGDPRPKRKQADLDYENSGKNLSKTGSKEASVGNTPQSPMQFGLFRPRTVAQVSRTSVSRSSTRFQSETAKNVPHRSRSSGTGNRLGTPKATRGTVSSSGSRTTQESPSWKSRRPSSAELLLGKDTLHQISSIDMPSNVSRYLSMAVSTPLPEVSVNRGMLDTEMGLEDDQLKYPRYPVQAEISPKSRFPAPMSGMKTDSTRAFWTGVMAREARSESGGHQQLGSAESSAISTSGTVKQDSGHHRTAVDRQKKLEYPFRSLHVSAHRDEFATRQGSNPSKSSSSSKELQALASASPAQLALKRWEKRLNAFDNAVETVESKIEKTMHLEDLGSVVLASRQKLLTTAATKGSLKLQQSMSIPEFDVSKDGTEGVGQQTSESPSSPSLSSPSNSPSKQLHLQRQSSAMMAKRPRQGSFRGGKQVVASPHNSMKRSNTLASPLSNSMKTPEAYQKQEHRAADTISGVLEQYALDARDIRSAVGVLERMQPEPVESLDQYVIKMNDLMTKAMNPKVKFTAEDKQMLSKLRKSKLWSSRPSSALKPPLSRPESAFSTTLSNQSHSGEDFESHSLGMLLHDDEDPHTSQDNRQSRKMKRVAKPSRMHPKALSAQMKTLVPEETSHAAASDHDGHYSTEHAEEVLQALIDEYLFKLQQQADSKFAEFATPPIRPFLEQMGESHMRLAHASFNSNQSKVVSQFLPYIPFLESIDLTDCGLQGSMTIDLLSGLWRSKHLKKIVFKGNRLGVNVLSSLAIMVADEYDDAHSPSLRKDLEDRILLAGGGDSQKQVDEIRNRVAADTARSEISEAGSRNGEDEGDSSVVVELSSQCKVLISTLSAMGTKIQTGVPYLSTLDLSNCSIGDAAVSSLAVGLSSNHSLTHLDLGFNDIGGHGAAAIGGGLKSNSTLKFLSLSWNRIRGEGAATFCDNLNNNTTLDTLLLNWNGFGDDKPMSSLSRMMKSAKLVELDLSHNRVSSTSASMFAGGLEKSPTLLRIKLDGNPLGKEGGRQVLRAASSEPTAFLGEERQVSIADCSLGIVQESAFDPANPSGNYSLELGEGYAQSVVRSLLQIAVMGRGFFVDGTFKLDGTDTSIFHKWIASARETDSSLVDLPNTGLVEFDFRARVDTAPPSAANIVQGSMVNLMASLIRESHTQAAKGAERGQYIDIFAAEDSWFSVDQISTLLKELDESEDRVSLVAKALHQCIEATGREQLLNLLSENEQGMLRREMGTVALSFTPLNPTGRYRLSLTHPHERRMASKICSECHKSEGAATDADIYYGCNAHKEVANLCSLVWRNGTISGQPYHPSHGQLPSVGTLSVDFVSPFHPPADSQAIKVVEWVKVKSMYSSMLPRKAEILKHLRLESNHKYYTSDQVQDMLQLMDGDSEMQAEVYITMRCRTMDWLGLGARCRRWMSIDAWNILLSRVGFANMFDDGWGVEYYELQLEDIEQRYVASKFLQLAVKEPGENFVQEMYDGMQFEIPSTWVQTCPKNGLLTFFYCRSTSVLRQIKNSYPPSAVPDCFDDKNPGGTDWVSDGKLRVIREKILGGKFSSIKECFNVFDADGSGDLTRKEFVMGLVSVGIRLRNEEIDFIVNTVDEDGSGLIELDELQAVFGE